MNEMETVNGNFVSDEFTTGEYPQWVKDEDSKKDTGIIAFQLEVDIAAHEIAQARNQIYECAESHFRRSLTERDDDVVRSLAKIKAALFRLLPRVDSPDLAMAQIRLAEAEIKLAEYKRNHAL